MGLGEFSSLPTFPTIFVFTESPCNVISSHTVAMSAPWLWVLELDSSNVE